MHMHTHMHIQFYTPLHKHTIMHIHKVSHTTHHQTQHPEAKVHMYTQPKSCLSPSHPCGCGRPQWQGWSTHWQRYWALGLGPSPWQFSHSQQDLSAGGCRPAEPVQHTWVQGGNRRDLNGACCAFRDGLGAQCVKLTSLVRYTLPWCARHSWRLG